MRKLLKEFGSSTLVRQATEEELAKRVGPRPQRRKSARITCVGQRRSPARFRSQRRDGGTAFRKKQRKVEIHTPQRGPIPGTGDERGEHRPRRFGYDGQIRQGAD